MHIKFYLTTKFFIIIVNIMILIEVFQQHDLSKSKILTIKQNGLIKNFG